MVTPEYTVQLQELFHGPMDLLLHLVREQEVDIHEVEINRVIDGYLEHLRALQEIDIELSGEFVVMAAHLMAIKSRSLLPREEVDLEQELDPRDELLQRLLEYRRFKDAARDLSARFDDSARRFPRADVRARLSGEERAGEEPTLDLGELKVWDLLAVYSRLVRETLVDRKLRIPGEGRPLRHYVDELVRSIRERNELSLFELVERQAGSREGLREQAVGTFCALLELMRLGVITARQRGQRGDIAIELLPAHASDIEEIVRRSGFDDEALTASPL